MRHARLVVLALLAEKDRHGYEVELEVRRRNIRLWARVGTSTIYKILNDFKRDGWAVGRAGSPERGAGREVFEITDLGRKELGRRVIEALRSRESPYSDRLVGLAFTPAIDRNMAEEGLDASIEGVGIALAGLEAARGGETGPVKEIILDFYRDVMEAERRALKAARRLIADEA